MNRTARALAIVLALVLVSVGIYAAYQNGFDAGALTASSGEGTTVVVDRSWGRGGGFGFFPFGFLFPLLFFFLIFGAFRGSRDRWGGPGPGWGGREHMERRLEEWHKQAHEQA